MRKFSLLLLLLLLLAMGSVVAAQDMPCGTLAEADCTFLTDSAAAMATVDSATFTLDLTITTSDGEDETSTTTISGGGAFNGATGLVGVGMMGMMTNPSSATDPTSMLGGLTEGLADFDGEINLIITSSEEDEPTDLQLRLVDGFGYINFDALGLSGDDDDDSSSGTGRGLNLSGWGGVNLIELITRAAEELPEGAMDGAMGGMMGGMAGVGNNPQLPEGFDPELMSSAIVITRLPDEEFNGVTVAVFQTTLDLASVMSDPAMIEAIQQQMAENMPADQEMTPEQSQQMMQGMMALYEGMNFSVITRIGIDDHYIRSIEANMSMDMSGMAAAAPADASVSNGSFSLAFSLTMDQFNEPQTITAPEEPNIVEVDDLLQMMRFFMAPRPARGS